MWFHLEGAKAGALPDDGWYGLGGVGDTPVVGDWNGDGLDDIGVFNAGYWFLDLNGNYLWDDEWYRFGGAKGKPVVGK